MEVTFNILGGGWLKKKTAAQNQTRGSTRAHCDRLAHKCAR